ncbi:MAG: murein biosynthesis integral membrane protein MurJ [Deltaproteobacteria bacterium]|nr:murein biosynthesis integral membrane protein MurJ [Deltaproteobacteria bacterium]
MNEERAIVRAAGQIGFYTLLSRVTGLLRDVIIGSVFGAGLQTDAFFVAFRIPNLLRRLVGEGASTAALVPVITECLTHRSRAEAMEMVRALFGVGLGILLVLTAAGVVWTAPLVHLFAPGFSGAKLDLTVSLARIMFLYLFCIGGVALVMGVLHALRHFAAPAFAPVLFNLAIIPCALWLSPHLAEPVLSLAYGVVIGGVCQIAWQLPALVRLGVPLLPRWRPGHPAIRRVAVLLLPLLFGTGVYQVNQIVSSLLASLLAEGSVSALWYASRLFEFPVGVFVTALSTAALPSLATQVQRRDLSGLRESLGFALRLVNLVTLPAAVGLAVLAVPISSVLFFRGAFGAAEVRVTAAALQGYAVGLWAVAATRLLSACLYALEDTRTPVWGGTAAFVAGVYFSLVLMGQVTASAESRVLARIFAFLSALLAVVDWGSAGLALATSLAAMVNLLLQAAALYRRLGVFPWAAWVSSLVWSVTASMAMAVPLWWTSRQVDWFDQEVSFALRAGVLALAVVVGTMSYVLVAWQGGKVELRALTGMLPQRLLRLLPQFLQPRG